MQPSQGSTPQTKDSQPHLIPTDGVFSIHYCGRYLYPLKNPLDAVLRRVRNVKIQEKTLFLIPSPLLSYGLKELADILPASSHLLCLELDKNLESITRLLESGKISYLFSSSIEKLSSFFLDHQEKGFRRCILLSLNGGYSLNRDGYDRVLKFLNHEIGLFWKNKMTLAHLGTRFLRNLFENLLLPWKDLSELNTSKPVLVVGAGESLEESISIIRSIRNKIFLLSVDTSLPALRDSEIRPDGVIALESQFYNLYDFFPEGLDDVPILADITSYPGVNRLFKERGYLFYSSFQALEIYKRLREHQLLPSAIPPLGSVGVAAIFVALTITTGPVLFTGLDFAYKPGKPHTKSAHSHLVYLTQHSRLKGDLHYGPSLSRPLIRIQGKKGFPITTDLVLKGYAEQMGMFGEDRLKDIGNSGLPTGIAQIKGEETILEFIDEYYRTIERNQPSSTRPDSPIEGKTVSDAWSPSFTPEILRLFLEGEIKLLMELRQIGSQYLTGEKNVTPQLKKLLKATDYVWFHFPDAFGQANLESGFLKRVLLSAEAYEGRLKILTSRLS